MALAAQVLDSARTHLNDEYGSLWTDQKLLPKLQEAHRELQSTLFLAGIPVINDVTAVLTVPANVIDGQNVDMSTVAGYPTNLVRPIWMKERTVGQQNQDFIDMIEVDFIPSISKDTRLVYWAWIGQTIMLLGATNDVQVQLRYRGSITVPTKVTDDCVVLFSETFLSYRTAALAIASTGQDDNKFRTLDAMAERNLDKLMRTAIKEEQNLPVRRVPYHRGRKSGFRGPIIGGGGSTGPGTAARALFFSGTINGTNGTDGNPIFMITNGAPMLLALYKNGQKLIQGVAFTLVGSTVTFLAPYIPITGDLLEMIDLG
jgi:hypothetical protein